MMEREQGYYYPLLLGFVSIVLLLLISTVMELAQQKEIEWWNQERLQVRVAAESALAKWQRDASLVPPTPVGEKREQYQRFHTFFHWKLREDGKMELTVVATGRKQVQKTLHVLLDVPSYEVIQTISTS